MKIAIEAQRIFRPNKHGMDFVALELIRELQKIDRTNQYRIYVAPGEDHCLQSTDNFEIVTLKNSNYMLFEQMDLPRAVSNWQADLLHCTSNTAPIGGDTPLVVTLHDVIFMESQAAAGGMTLYQRLGRLYRRTVVPRVIPRAERVITVSEYEAGVICRTMGLPPTKLSVIYNGVNQTFIPTPLSDEIRRRYSLPDQYLFFLGNSDPKKNSRRVLEAYSLYRSRSDDPLPLVIADYPRGLIGAAEGVIPIGYVYNSDLAQIYSGATLFLYPSLRESFGIPILEAMGCGTPVVTSNTSAMPEIASDAALFVDPLNAQSIADAIIRLTTDHKLHSYYRSKGIERNSFFSWKASARELLKIYETL